MTIPLFELNKVYSFNTLSPVFLGNRVDRAKARIIGCSANMARKFASVDHMWRSIYPTLPTGTVNDVERAIWYVLEGQNGSEIVLCDKWIDQDSIVLIDHVQITVSFPTASMGDADIIRNALNAAGLRDYAISVSDPPAA